MPSKPIERSYAGPGLLARIVTAKFAEHTPHYRQSEIYRRQGVELSRATLGRWSGAVSELLEPLYDLLRQYVLMPGKVHTDDIPVLVQEPGSGKTRTPGCGSTSGMTVTRGHSSHRRCGSRTRRTGKVCIRSNILPGTAVSCRRTRTGEKRDQMSQRDRRSNKVTGRRDGPGEAEPAATASRRLPYPRP